MRWKPRLIPGGRSSAEGSAGPRPPAHARSDADLVQDVIAGVDEATRPGPLPGHDAFAALVERHQDQVMRLAIHLLRDSDEARDVAQDAFLRAYRSLATFRPDGSFRNWLLAITVNAARDHHARRPGRHLRPLDEGAGVAGPSDTHRETEGVLMLERVRACVADLAPREREVFVLRDLEGLEVEEIAPLLGLEPPTVRRHLARARLRLRELLGSR